MRKCRVSGCPHHVREGLRRAGLVKGCDGQELADGETCWRCRAKAARRERAGPRRASKKGGGKS